MVQTDRNSEERNSCLPVVLVVLNEIPLSPLSSFSSSEINFLVDYSPCYTSYSRFFDSDVI